MLARIRSRSSRPKVARDASLAAQDNISDASNATPSNEASEGPIAPEVAPSEEVPQKAPLPPAPTSDISEAKDLEAKIDALPKVAARRNIRLEESLDAAMQQFCMREGVTIDTFLEAALLACDRNATLKQRIVKEAKQRLQQRKEAGKLRRIHSQLLQIRH